MNKRQVNNIIVGVLIVILLILAYLVIRPILFSIIFGLIFAYVFHPIFRKINKSLKNDALSATILLLLLAFLILAPIIYFTPRLIEQVFALFEVVRQINIAELIVTFFPVVEPGSTAYSLIQNFNSVPAKFIGGFTDNIFSVFVNFPNLIVQGFVFLFTFFFAIKDSKKLGDYFNDVSPFSKATEKRFLREFRGITNSVILGQVLIGIVQGLALGICMWILGVENVLTWTLVTIIVSIIPIIGAWLVWVPLSIYLLLTGDSTSAIILALYSGLFVSNIDNILRPYFLSKTTKLPVVVSLVGTIGGLYFFGILGLVLGPLILAYALIIIDFYKEGRLDELYRESQHHSIGSYEIKS